jgi:hypothetical protein
MALAFCYLDDVCIIIRVFIFVIEVLFVQTTLRFLTNSHLSKIASVV